MIYTAEEILLIGLSPYDLDKHFKLMVDIDMSGYLFNQALIGSETAFTGFFDGNNHTISHLTIEGEHSLGLFGQLEVGAEIKNIGVVDVNITGSG